MGYLTTEGFQARRECVVFQIEKSQKAKLVLIKQVDTDEDVVKHSSLTRTVYNFAGECFSDIGCIDNACFEHNHTLIKFNLPMYPNNV